MRLEHRVGELPEVERDAILAEPDGVFEDRPMPVFGREVDVDVCVQCIDIDRLTPVAPALEIS